MISRSRIKANFPVATNENFKSIMTFCKAKTLNVEVELSGFSW